MRLAQYEMIEAETGKKPVLLLDDIFDKLDERRITQLIALMDGATFGQVLITDARPERTKALLAGLNAETCFIEIRKDQLSV